MIAVYRSGFVISDRVSIAAYDNVPGPMLRWLRRPDSITWDVIVQPVSMRVRYGRHYQAVRKQQ
jgi:hypothetical protein